MWAIVIHVRMECWTPHGGIAQIQRSRVWTSLVFAWEGVIWSLDRFIQFATRFYLRCLRLVRFRSLYCMTFLLPGSFRHDCMWRTILSVFTRTAISALLFTAPLLICLWSRPGMPRRKLQGVIYRCSLGPNRTRWTGTAGSARVEETFYSGPPFKLWRISALCCVQCHGPAWYRGHCS